MFGRDPKIMTKELTFPQKRAVSTPLSQFLTREVGRGIEPGRYSEFLEMEPEKFFERKVVSPVMKGWREEVAPLIKEEWAGGLRGSGMFRSLEESATAVSEKLGEIGGTMVPQLYQQQFSMWLKTLPQYNPVLDTAIKYLQESTSTGRKILSGLYGGTEGAFGDIIKAGAAVAAAVAAA